MRQVRTCDFCGAEASGTYEPLPASIPGGPRLLLCDGCRDRLGTVVDPLLARLDEATDPAGDTGGRRQEAPDGGAGVTSGGGRSRESPPDHERSTAESTGSVVSESRDAGGRSQAERGGTPPGYRKVMRLLENRELPMAREDAEHLAAEAYDLDPAEVAQAIDHAVEYGRLREVDGQLKQ